MSTPGKASFIKFTKKVLIRPSGDQEGAAQYVPGESSGSPKSKIVPSASPFVWAPGAIIKIAALVFARSVAVRVQ